jgi:hypothetical protein
MEREEGWWRWRNEDGDGGRSWALLVRACLFSCALLVRAGACFVFGFNGHLLAWVADAIVARYSIFLQ